MPNAGEVFVTMRRRWMLSRPDPHAELELTSIHEGVTIEQVRAATGWDLKVAEDLTRAAVPSAEEISLPRDAMDRVRLYLR